MSRYWRADSPSTSKVWVRVTAQEKQALCDEAELAGLTISELFRRRAFGRKVTHHADLKMINELRRLGGLFKHAHIVTGGVLSQETAVVIADIRATMKAIMQAAERGSQATPPAHPEKLGIYT